MSEQPCGSVRLRRRRSVACYRRSTPGAPARLSCHVPCLAAANHLRRWIVVNEVRLLASLSHPNVVVFKSSFVEDGCLNVIMEVVAHGDLSAVIE